jgi:hypothetical protein
MAFVYILNVDDLAIAIGWILEKEAEFRKQVGF